MFRSFMTLIRGAANEADEAFADAHALPILRQQMRDCARAVSVARKALALAMAQHEQEVTQAHDLARRIADLETRALAALENGENALVQEAAVTIARLQTEQDTAKAVLGTLEADLACLRASVTTSEERLRALKRGARIATVTDKTQRLTASAHCTMPTVLRDAEATLERLRARQTETDAANAALDALENAGHPERLRDRLAEAGCGAPLKITADAVLERLRARSVTPA